MKSWFQTLFQHFRYKIILSLFIFVLLSASEGVGFMLLVPMLGFIGLLDGGGITGKINEILTVVFSSTGLPISLGSILLFYIFLVSFREWLMRQQSVMNTEIQSGLVSLLRVRLFTAIVQSNWLFLTRSRHSDFTHSLTADINRIGMGVSSLSQIVTGLLMLLVYFFFAFLLSPQMTGIALGSALVFLFVFKNRVFETEKTGKKETGAGKKFFFIISEHLGSMKLSKIFSAEEKTIEHFKRATDELQTNVMIQTMEGSNLRMYFAIGSVCTFSLFFYFAVTVFAVPSDALILLLVVFARIMPSVSGLMRSTQDFLRMRPALASYQHLEEQCYVAKEDSDPAEQRNLKIQKSIRFEKVSFRYDKSKEQYPLKDVSFDIEVEKTTALTGPSGSGKSTIADLLMGLLVPDEGGILIDDKPLTTAQIPRWRKSLAYVPQEPFLFHDTIRNNLLWAKPDATEEDITSALELAAALEFVKTLPNGFETVVGERGVKLSGGERQRIALARALLLKPELLILDEATSSLDHENEQKIKESLDSLHGGMTIVIIAHRHTTIQSADKVLVLEKGRVKSDS